VHIQFWYLVSAASKLNHILIGASWIILIFIIYVIRTYVVYIKYVCILCTYARGLFKCVYYIVVSYRKNDVATVRSNRLSEGRVRLSEIYLHYNNICTDTDTPSPPPLQLRCIAKLRSVSLAMPIRWQRLQRLSLSSPSPNVRPTPLVPPHSTTRRRP